ncbi:PEP-CTERM sorting domain-containing protein [Haloferula sp.]|uniref:PEP-CTERM sorting domain-containing protein n=1 Tax=Haloferula sp. TaxID=2497595 RepID=UPI003C753821
MKSIPILTALAVTAQAAVVDTNYTNPGPDGAAFPYEAFVTMSANDSWSSVTTVGGWSYVDLASGANPNRGWGHATSWYLLQLDNDSIITLSMNGTSADARPGFVIFSGESINDDPAALHTFSNNGLDWVMLNDSWDDNGALKAAANGDNTNDPGLGFAGNAVSLSANSVTDSFSLPAGRYTIGLGNAADSGSSPTGQDMNFDFATIPEPSAAALLALGLGLSLRRRR